MKSEKCMDRWKDEQMKGKRQMNGQKGEWIKILKNGWKDGWMNKQVNKYRWMSGKRWMMNA